jgi:tetratricopeptide (TPR) repeat protein
MESLKKEDIRKSLPPELYAINQLFAGAALGDYDAMEEALAAIEKSMRENLIKSRDLAHERVGRNAPALLMMPKIGSAAALAAGAVALSPLPLQEINTMRDLLHLHQNELSNAITLRGIVALEAGNTEYARTLFQRALDEAGDAYYFTERPVARRYLELLNEQKR